MIESILSANTIAVEEKATIRRKDSNTFNIQVTCMDGRVDIDNDTDVDALSEKYSTIWLGSAGCKLLLGNPTMEDIENYFQKYFRTAQVRNQVVAFNLESHSHAPSDPEHGCGAHKSDTVAALRTTYDVATKFINVFPQANIYRTHRYTNSTEGKIVLASLLPEGKDLTDDQKRFDPPGFQEKLLNNTIGINRDAHTEKVFSFTNVPLAFPRRGFSSLQCSYPISPDTLPYLIGLGLGIIFNNALKDYQNRSLPAVLHFDSAYGTYNHASFEEARLALEEIKNLLKHTDVPIIGLTNTTVKKLIDDSYIQLLWTVTSDATLETQKVVM